MAYLFSGCMRIFFGIVFLFGALGFFAVAETPNPGEDWYFIGQVARFVFTGLFLIFGLVFLISGVRTFAELPSRRRLLKELQANGVSTTAKVTFVDRNFSTKLNGNYIYTIVEYEYHDQYGNLQSHRLPRVPSEIVIRRKIEVGSTINIVYLPHKPEKSGWLELMQDVNEG